ncbi:cupin domain-containing protein [Glaciihabitans sp. dw_435]|uniref:cupin domain-containing protein n=1 Tax=Glaciihabitans sp. dw_435 TaxID=2720081 RepID=UPI001BD3BFA0|nr:cupin domain-containing protein [Glaciihabitans sp. dw_435]
MVMVRPALRRFAVADAEIFRGQVLVSPIVGRDDVDSVLMSEVTFTSGARTVWHRHAQEQILVITKGSGIVADRTTEHTVEKGDVVVVPAGDEHWHGAPEGSTMSHLAVLLSTETTLLDEVGQ